MKIFTYINKIGECVTDLEEKYYSNYENKLLIAFRGESQDFGKTKLVPSMFRENKYINKENYLFDLFCDFGLINTDDKWIDKATTTQHYAALSRMLDITFDCLVALYFTCISDKDKDGFIYVFGFPEFQSPHSENIEILYNNVLNSDSNIIFPRNFYVFSESYSNDRIVAQKGGFIFFPSKTFSPINHVYYKTVKISYKDKEKIITDLDKFFKINTAILFPEKDKIASYAKQKFIEGEYKIEEISFYKEVKNRINQISYELKMNTDLDTVQKLRYIRKYEEELILYIWNQEKIELIEKENILNEIMMSFKVLNVFFGGGLNG